VGSFGCHSTAHPSPPLPLPLPSSSLIPISLHLPNSFPPTNHYHHPLSLNCAVCNLPSITTPFPPAPCSVSRFLVKFLLLLSLLSCRISLPFPSLSRLLTPYFCLVSYCSSTPPPSRCFEQYRYFPKRCINFPFDFYSSGDKKATRDRSTPRQLQFTRYSSVPHCWSFFFFFFHLQFHFIFQSWFAPALGMCIAPGFPRHG